MKLLFLDGFETNENASTDRGSGIQYAVARGIKDENKKIQIVVASNINIEWANCSKYVDDFYYLKDAKNELEYMNDVLKKIKEYDIDMIFPVSEQGLKFVLANKNIFSKACKIATVPDQDIFNICIDKWKMYQILSEHNISLPHSELFSSFDKYEPSYYPRLFKPTSGDTGRGIFILTKPPSLKYIEKFKLEGRQYISQEYIEGYDVGISVLCQNGKILLNSIQKAHGSYGTPFSANTIKLEFIHNEEILKIATQSMHVLNYNGIANLDIRYDQNKNKFVLLEINPRYWGSLNASLAIGVNFPYYHYLLSLEKPFEYVEYKDSYYVYFSMLLKDIIKMKYNYKLSKYNIKYMFTDLCIYWIKIKNRFK